MFVVCFRANKQLIYCLSAYRVPEFPTNAGSLASEPRGNHELDLIKNCQMINFELFGIFFILRKCCTELLLSPGNKNERLHWSFNVSINKLESCSVAMHVKTYIRSRCFSIFTKPVSIP